VPRDEVRVMVQALGKLMGSPEGEADGVDLLEGCGEGDVVPGRKERRTFGHLMSWADEFLSDNERRENIKIVYDETEEFLGPAMPSLDIFVEVLGRLYINGFEICDDKMSTYGWGVFLGPSILDHSCRPNAAVSFTGPLLTVRTLQPLDCLEDALITYVDPDLPGPVRREKLQSNYFFLCGCVKCKHASGREREAALGGKKEKEVGEKKRRQRGRK